VGQKDNSMGGISNNCEGTVIEGSRSSFIDPLKYIFLFEQNPNIASLCMGSPSYRIFHEEDNFSPQIILSGFDFGPIHQYHNLLVQLKALKTHFSQNKLVFLTL
jgi:hypothetical protein